MWKSNSKAQKDNKNEPIQLLIPTKQQQSQNSAISSYIGGQGYYYTQDTALTNILSNKLKCKVCNQDLYLLLQLYTPIHNIHRTLYVYGCNTDSCCNYWNGVSDLMEYDCGSFVCLRSQIPIDDDEKVSKDKANQDSLSKDNDDNNEDDFDWGCDDDNNLSMQELEAMLNNNTSLTNQTEKEDVPKTNEKEIESTILNSTNNFSQCNVQWINEPKTDATKFNDNDSSDEDEYNASIDDMKIELMLSKYLDVEEDEYIKQSIANCKNKKNVVNESSGENEEVYERLLPKQQVFYTFTNRIKRAPSQILRYAYGGIPMWSIPCIDISYDENKKNVTKIPNCTCCGSKREFEFQLIPSLLHILHVDQNDSKEYILSSLGSKNDENATKSSAMNWGSIAIYSCSMSCELSRKEYVIVQSAV